MRALLFSCIPLAFSTLASHAATLLNNGDFENWTGVNPVGWSPASNGSATKVTGLGSGNAIQVGLTSPGADAHVRGTLTSTLGPNTPFTFSIDFYQAAMTTGERGFNVTLRSTSDPILNFAVIGNRLNSTHPVGGTPTFGEISSYDLNTETWYRLVVTGNLGSGGSYSLELYDLTAGTSTPVISLEDQTRWQSIPSASTTINEVRLERGRSGYDWVADNVSVIPEPGSLLLGGLGILGFAARRRRAA